MKFYIKPGACSMVGQVALAWAKIDYEAISVDEAQSQSAEYLAKNPMAAVPLLEDGDFVLSQNVAIMHYLAATHPEAHLFGTGDAKQQAQAYQWFAFINADIHSKFVILFRPARYASHDSAQADVVHHTKALLRQHFEIVNQHLEGRNYLTDELTIADVYMMVVLNWAKFKNINLSGLNNLSALQQRVASDAAVQKVVAMQQH